MAYLEISKPLRPLKFGREGKSRLVYRIVMDDGKMLTLPELCRKLCIPHSSLSTRIQGLTIGRHEDAFWIVVADVTKRARAGRLVTQRCTHCKGSGRVPKSTNPSSSDSNEATS